MKLPQIQRRPAAPDLLPGGRLGPAASPASTGSPRPARRGGRCCRSARPTATARPTRPRSAFAAWRGLLAEPDAPVAPEEEDAFRERHAFWIEGWEAYAGAARVADQVRFDREWGALRAYAARARRAADRRRPDLRRARRRRPPRVARALPARRRGRRAARRVHGRRASTGATRSTTGPRCGGGGYRWWIERLRRTFELFDLARIDHFRGFVAYWAVPAGAPDAR